MTSVEDSRRCGNILRIARNLQTLTLCCGSDALDFAPTQWDEFPLLFSPWLKPTSPPEKLRLAKLSCQGVDAAVIGYTLTHAINFAHLNELHMRGCRDIGHLYNVLRQSKSRLKILCAEGTEIRPESADSLESFLSSSTGLEALKISLPQGSQVVADCSWSAIKTHASTPRTLCIDDFGPLDGPPDEYEHDRSLDKFRELCMSCSKLEQLAIAIPRIGRRDWNEPGGIMKLADCFALLPSLKVLRLFTHPKPSDCTQKEISSLTFEHELFQLALKDNM